MYKIFAITNRHLCKNGFLEVIRRLTESGVDGIILREKDLKEEEYLKLAEAVLGICEGKKRCILHTYVDAAGKLGCTDIHLTLPLLLSLSQHEPERLQGFSKIGASVHSAEEARKAQNAGAGYLIAGHVFATDCKKGVEPRGLDFIRGVSRAVDIPVYGIGGITRENMMQVIHAGADGVCMMSSMMTGNNV